ncbi:hypothetical protein BCR36DRAFT_357819 [Piromyces finnis]|uniref:Right handed beta helix domain-containing protein n=1 Tax=Piromyces finnis TaxID=1754191 RepID=A0A1Y1V2M8_9FUNG|nr:hypothetical protein BCR36DRAFT_357819 [Piromyces finnis]|eukprot:ORX45745.1 hypothetical protein BCR36DRAFT_357819 [Piromyces finnis]
MLFNKNMDKIFYILCIIYIVFHINAKEIVVRNKDENFKNLQKVVNNNQNDKELIVRFIDPEYDMYDEEYMQFDCEFTILTNVTFIGNTNGTVFNYKGDKRGRMKFIFINSTNYRNKVIVKNIAFKDYEQSNYLVEGVGLHRIVTHTDNFQCIFENCIFDNAKQALFFIRNDLCSKPLSEESYVLFNNCIFNNNYERVIKSEVQNTNEMFDLQKCLYININNSQFINNRGLFFINNSYVTINNCTFSGIEKDSDFSMKSAFYHADLSSNYFIIRNSLFKNIYIKTSYPLIDANELRLTIENTTFQDCFSDYSYLFDLRTTKEPVVLKNTTFISKYDNSNFNKIIFI